MSKEQKLILTGLQATKKKELAQVTNALKARISSISISIMPEMDIPDQNFVLAKTMIDECIDLKEEYDSLNAEIKELEESI